MLFYPESITQLELMEDNISTIQINNTLQNLGRLYISGNPLGEIKP
jgi:Leucine-rich repeat (LRR) protein